MKKYIGTKQIEAEPMTRGDAWEKHLLRENRQRKILMMRVIMSVMKMDMKAGVLKIRLKRRIILPKHQLTVCR